MQIPNPTFHRSLCWACLCLFISLVAGCGSLGELYKYNSTKPQQQFRVLILFDEREDGMSVEADIAGLAQELDSVLTPVKSTPSVDSTDEEAAKPPPFRLSETGMLADGCQSYGVNSECVTLEVKRNCERWRWEGELWGVVVWATNRQDFKDVKIVAPRIFCRSDPREYGKVPTSDTAVLAAMNLWRGKNSAYKFYIWKKADRQHIGDGRERIASWRNNLHSATVVEQPPFVGDICPDFQTREGSAKAAFDAEKTLREHGLVPLPWTLP